MLLRVHVRAFHYNIDDNRFPLSQKLVFAIKSMDFHGSSFFHMELDTDLFTLDRTQTYRVRIIYLISLFSYHKSLNIDNKIQMQIFNQLPELSIKS